MHSDKKKMMEGELVPLTSIVEVSVPEFTKRLLVSKHFKTIPSPPFHPSLSCSPLPNFSHKGVWKEEEDHLLKWNLRSDGWELVEGERSSAHPRGGGWWTGGGGGESSLNPHSHLSLWVEGMQTSHAVQLRKCDWFSPKCFKLLPVFPQIFFFFFLLSSALFELKDTELQEAVNM